MYPAEFTPEYHDERKCIGNAAAVCFLLALVSSIKLVEYGKDNDRSYNVPGFQESMFAGSNCKDRGRT